MGQGSSLTEHIWLMVYYEVVVKLRASPGWTGAGERASKLTQVPVGRPPKIPFQFTHVVAGRPCFLFTYFVYCAEAVSTFCVGGQIVNIFTFADHMVSATNYSILLCSAKATANL